jgi:hypothetical protein
MPTPIRTFEGVNFGTGSCNCAPPDTNGDVGPNHYVQIVNSDFQVFNKTGGSLLGPLPINSIWSGFGGQCQNTNDGDPVVLYDPLADRWLVSQFVASSPFGECIAISQTADPTGAWHRYFFQLTTVDFPDYPKLGVWPDGYYMSEVWFNGGTTYGGPRPYVFDRARMLQGLSASFQTTAGPLGNTVGPLLPADLDGSTPPPAGAPNYFLGTPFTGGTLPLYKFHVDWDNPGNSTFTGPTNLAGAAYTALCPFTRSCVPQADTTSRLDGIGDRIMFRAAYRNFGDHESLVGNLTVSSGGVGAIRWYELRGLNGTPSLFQQGTYQPDSTYRWMGSIAMDRDGNIAVGYSASSDSINPQIRYAGRLATDPLGQLSQGEATLFSGTGSQIGTSSRWGDYSMMAVDPSDDCTFWYTQEYYSTTSQFNWRTRIGAFKFPSCGVGATPTPTGVPPTATHTPTPAITPTPSSTPTPGVVPICPEPTAFNGTIELSDPTMTGRMFRDGVSSTCGAPKTCPGPFDAVPYHYDQYGFLNNTSLSRCVTVNVDAQSCTGSNFIFSQAYLAPFDPNNVCTAYLADIGSSPNPTGSYSFDVPAGQAFYLVFNEVSQDAGCAGYTFSVVPDSCPALLYDYLPVLGNSFSEP